MVKTVKKRDLADTKKNTQLKVQGAEEDKIVKKTPENIEALKMEAKNIIIVMVITLILFAVPSLENARKTEIIHILAAFDQISGPLSNQGVFGMAYYSCLIAVWDGFQILPIRYVEFFVALNYPSYFDFILIIVLGKTLGSLISYRLANYILSKEEMRQVMINTTSTFYFRAVEMHIRNNPFPLCLVLKIFFPSIIASIGISLLLPSRNGQQQYAFISMVAAILGAVLSAIHDLYPFLATKIFSKRSPYS